MTKELSNCYADVCPYAKPHVHVNTANGSYVRYMDMTRLCPHNKPERICSICINIPKKTKDYGDE